MKSLFFLLLILNFQMNSSFAAKLNEDTDLLKKAKELEKAINKKKLFGKKDLGLNPSTSSGTSAYMMFDYEGIKGAILPENSATVVLGEVFAYQLSRALEIDEIFAAKTLIFLNEEGLDELEVQIETMTNHSYPMKRDNAKRVIGLIDQARSLNDGIYVAYAPWNLPKAIDYPSIVASNAINFSHPLVQLLQNANTDKETVTAKLESEWRKKVGATTKIDAEILVRDLSNILVVDILSNQWDRYSGGNIQVFVDKNKVLRFGAYDNGGTFENNTKIRASNLKALLRFDKKTADYVVELNEFINLKGKSFRGLTDLSEFKKLLELHVAHRSLRKYYYAENVTDTNERYFKQFKASLSILADHIKITCKSSKCSL